MGFGYPFNYFTGSAPVPITSVNYDNKQTFKATCLADPIEFPQSEQDQTSKTPADIDPIWFSLDSERKWNRIENTGYRGRSGCRGFDGFSGTG